jgi:cytidylate kinase
MDGRDIGTVILPNADVKIFLTASIEARAERRYAELCEKGIKTSYDEVLSDMRLRDDNDSSRSIAPAIPAKDAVMFDNSNDNIPSTVEKIKKIIEDKTGYAL